MPRVGWGVGSRESSRFKICMVEGKQKAKMKN
jgi:hypothetical protein